MSVTIAARVFGSELLVSLIRYYRMHPGLQKEAAAALDIPAQAVSTNTRVLVDAGVVVGDPPPWGVRPGRWIVDEERVRNLAAVLVAFTMGDLAGDDFEDEVRRAAADLRAEGL